jgi:hypothetical protein
MVRQPTVPEWGQYDPYRSYSEADENCPAGAQPMLLWRGGYGCNIDRDSNQFREN